MSKLVFSRNEIKYIITSSEQLKIEEGIREYVKSDPYSKGDRFYTITNLYFDTKEDELIRHSLSKPIYKEKIRLRGYGVPSMEDIVFLEIKKKYKSLVNKRRVNLRLKDAKNYLNNRLKPDDLDFITAQVFKELDYMLSSKEFFPKAYIAYDRKAFFGKDSDDLRITFDKNIRARRQDLELEKGDYGELILDKSLWIMEIKCNECIPLWLTKLLAKEDIKKSSFSKYGKEYTQCILNNKKEMYKSVG